ncbi:MAG: sulfatase-like hydrolase/transferase, partial [Verrucomicrobiales bacterium]|nr:sulfatase-like hydrolase/transferase [Verrucomicrobiales bacterium]
RGRSPSGPRGDFVAQVDDTVGRLLRELDERGLSDDTLFVFTSDNGAHWLPSEVESTGHAANGPWRGMKSDAFEGGHRVPFVARWPGRIRAGTTSRAVIGLQDVFATIADVLERPLPPGTAEDSLSFLPALRGKAVRRTTPLVLHSARGAFVLRDGPWKWIDASDSGGWTEAKFETAGQLYHLGRDPGETHNLADTQPDKVRALRAKLEKLREIR